LHMQKPTLDFWFDFASTYSYVAAMRIAQLAGQTSVSVRWRPFLLGPIFHAQGMDNSPFNLFPVKGRYMWRDMERLCADVGATFRRPDPFPQNSLMAARVAMVGLQADWGKEFCRRLFRAEFADGHDIGKAETIAAVLIDLGFKPADIIAQAQTDANKALLRTQTDAAAGLHIFGAPTFSTADGEIFWGNDRLEQALAWTKK
jgi:2-hydroxychromene-2-carboxylate isomerase